MYHQSYTYEQDLWFRPSCPRASKGSDLQCRKYAVPHSAAVSSAGCYAHTGWIWA